MGALSVILSLLLACMPAQPPVVPWVGGCLEWADTCQPRGDSLHLWVPDTEAVEVSVDGAALAVSTEPVDGGVRLVVPATPGELRVSVPGHEAWSLMVEDPEEGCGPKTSPLHRVLRQRCAEPALLREQTEGRDGAFAAYVADSQDFTAGRLGWSGVAAHGVVPQVHDADSRLMWSWLGALVAEQAGQHGTALDLLEEARRYSHRVWDDAHEPSLVLIHGRLLERSGRLAEAIALVEAATERHEALSLKGPRAVALMQLRHLEHGGTDWPRGEPLRRLRPLHQRVMDERGDLRGESLVDLARARWIAGEDPTSTLAELQGIDLRPWTAAAMAEVRAQVDLDHGELERAGVRIDAALQLDAPLDVLLRLRSLRLQILALARPTDAVAAYPGHLDRWAQAGLLLGVSGERAAFLDRSRRDLEAYVELLLAERRVDDAWSVLREQRTAILRSALSSMVSRIPADTSDTAVERLQTVQGAQKALGDWFDAEETAHETAEGRRRADALRQRFQETVESLVDLPAPSSEASCAVQEGEVVLTRSGSRWLARDVGGVRPVTVDEARALGADATVLFLEDASFHGAAGSIDTLGLDRAVVWRLGLGCRAPVERGRRAVVVGDPEGNLAAARRESAGVGAALQAQGWTITSARATPKELWTELGQTDLFHFAGHGSRDPRTGSPHLRLAGGRTLGVPEILALPRAPGLVFLNGCNTASSEGEVFGAFGLASALVLRGTDAVIATAAPVDSRHAEQVAGAFYTAWLSGQSPVQAMNTTRRSLGPIAAPFLLVTP